MKRFVSVLVAALSLLICGGVGQVRAGTMWNVGADFSITNGNPNGAWSYGYVNNYNFYLDVSTSSNPTNIAWLGNLGPWPDGTPCVWKNIGTNTIAGVQPGQVALHPGDGGKAGVARWTAPSPMTVAVQGQFLPGASGIPLVGIFVNGTPQVSLPYWQSIDSGAFNFTVPVSTGNTIDFAVYGAYSSCTTPLNATIQAVPEPSTFILLGIGAAVYALRRKKHKRGNFRAAMRG